MEMRAKPVVTKAFIFDFDDTLFTTEAKVHVYDNDSGEYIKSLNAEEFNRFKKLPSQFLDFQDFVNSDIVLKAKPYKAFDLLEEVDKEINSGILFGDIYILTARTPHVQRAIYELLRSKGIENVKGNNIICMGDGRGEIDIAAEKKKYLQKISNQYDKTYFYDDDKRNVKASKELGINGYLIEEYIKK